MPVESFDNILTQITDIWVDLYQQYVVEQEDSVWRGAASLLPGILELEIDANRCQLLILVSRSRCLTNTCESCSFVKSKKTFYTRIRHTF